MNQPKFKFGDKVKNIIDQDIFDVRAIHYDHHEEVFRYGNCTTTYGDSELDLELYQEPQKKKLYAYKTFYTAYTGSSSFNGDVVRFFSNVDVDCFEAMGKIWGRAKEYDIEFDEAK